MLYRIGFWVGPPPATDVAACEALHQQVYAYDHAWEAIGTPAPPVPAIAEFVRDVLREFPCEPFESSVWKFVDVAESAQGQYFVADLRGSRGGDAVRLPLARLAAQHGINGFDLVEHRRLDANRRPGASPWLSEIFAEQLDCHGPSIARARLGLTPPANDMEDVEDADELS